jgi:hypothetical protein
VYFRVLPWLINNTLRILDAAYRINELRISV